MLNYKQNNQYKSQLMLPTAEQQQKQKTAKEIFPTQPACYLLIYFNRWHLAIYLFITVV